MAAVINEGILWRESPNFFELLAEETLREALRPALHYLCKVLARYRPHRFSLLWRSRDEVHLLLDSALQLLFLRTCESSFSEHFYGLKRVCVKRGGFSSRNVFTSFFFLVLVPYLKVKIERLYSVLSDEHDSIGISWQRQQTLTHRLKFLFFTLTPYLQSLWALTCFVFRLGYLMQRFSYYSPMHWLAGIRLAHDTQTSGGSSESQWQWAGGQTLSLSLSLFSLRLLQWWYSGENDPAVRKMTSLLVPPPPPHSQPSSDGVSLPSDSSVCPICLQIRHNPTALASSGFVFCYECIAAHIDNHGKCPITSLPSSHRHLTRLFLSHPHTIT